MLSFSSSLTNAFKRDNFRGYWLFKLYYDNESAFTGVSDIPRDKGGDKYFGAVLGSSGLHQSCDIDSFRVEHGTLTLTVRNDLNSVEGSRFSDLYSSREYSNRKWELIQGDENADFSADNMIASGVISDKTPQHDTLTCSIYLDDWWVKYNKELPTTRVTAENYPNAPEKNLDKPIPIWYGDYQSDNLTAALNTYEFQKIKVPAIITNKSNDDESGLTVHPDIETIDEVTNVFMYDSGIWQVANDTPVVNNPDATFKGHTFSAFYPLTAHEDEVSVGTCTDYEEAFDEDGDTDATWNISGVSAPGGYIAFSIPDTVLRSLGKSVSVVTVKLWGSLAGTVTDDILMTLSFDGGDAEGQVITISAGLNEYDITSMFSSSELESWSFQKDVLTIQVSNVEDMVMYINHIGIEVTYLPNKTYVKSFYSEVETTDRESASSGGGYAGGGTRGVTTTRRFVGDIETVYVTGQGRVYGSWIDTIDGGARADYTSETDPGYASGAMIENPVYIIEDILRSELGLDETSIDCASFDIAGNTTDGDLKNTFNDAMTDIKFALSQHKLINTRELIYKICELSGLYFWWSNGKAKVRARRRTYTTADLEIDYEKDIAFRSAENPSIPLIRSFKTQLNSLVNYLTINYAYDYGPEQTIKSSTPDDNGNLKDTTSRDAYSTDETYFEGVTDFDFTTDSTTANNLGEAQLSWFKDRKSGVRFPALKPALNALEFGDIVNFTNWDSNHKIWGETITSAMAWMVVEPMKNNNNAMIGVIRVPGTIS